MQEGFEAAFPGEGNAALDAGLTTLVSGPKKIGCTEELFKCLSKNDE